LVCLIKGRAQAQGVRDWVLKRVFVGKRDVMIGDGGKFIMVCALHRLLFGSSGQREWVCWWGARVSMGDKRNAFRV
jgi:hypothetical protein